MEFDYVIVGAGTAGCTLAARLSEDHQVSVLLLEAGGAGGGLWESLPLGVGKVLNHDHRVWRDDTVPAAGTGGRSVAWVSGRAVGGSSTVNAMLFMRGHPAAYDRMAAAGCPGWSYADCLPYFRRLEDCRFSASPARAAGGPVGVSLIAPDPISDAFLDACVAQGYPRVADYNADAPDGASYLQISARNGLRSSARAAYIDAARGRGNLVVRTGALVQRVLFRGRAATGVEFRVDGEQLQALARREVILAAGAVRTPALLERSGVGQRRRLESLGIAVVADREAVGENLQDHFMPRICYATPAKGTVNHFLNSLPTQVLETLKFALTRKGTFAQPPLTATAYLRSDPSLPLPDLRLQVGLMSAEKRIPTANPAGTTAAERAGLDPTSSFHIGVYGIYPEAKGSVHIRSADPDAPPAVQPNYLGEAADRKALVAGLRLVQRLAASEPLRGFVSREIRPAFAQATDEQILAYAQATGHTCWHPNGTCRMGEDADAVVDTHCRVKALERLRVVDCSVFPFLTSSNTNVPVFMLAEKVAQAMRDGG